MENTEKPRDGRSLTSPINGRLGGRPRVWKINPYEMIRSLKRNPSFYAEQDIKELQAMIDRRRKSRQKKELAAYHKRPDLALKQIAHQKELRKKKLNELRYLRMVVRRLMAQLESLDAGDLDITRDVAPRDKT